MLRSLFKITTFDLLNIHFYISEIVYKCFTFLFLSAFIFILLIIDFISREKHKLCGYFLLYTFFFLCHFFICFFLLFEFICYSITRASNFSYCAIETFHILLMCFSVFLTYHMLLQDLYELVYILDFDKLHLRFSISEPYLFSLPVIYTDLGSSNCFIPLNL